MKKYVALKETTHNNQIVKVGEVISSETDLEKLNPIAFISEDNKAKKDAEEKSKTASLKPDAEKLKDALGEIQKLQREIAALKAKENQASNASAKGKGGKAETKIETKIETKPKGDESKDDEHSASESGEGSLIPEGDDPEGNEQK